MTPIRATRTGWLFVLTVLGALAAGSWLLAGWSLQAWQALAASPVVSLDLVLGLVAATAATLTTGWLLLSTSWCLLRLLRGVEPPALTPLLVRRFLVLALGVGLAAAATPARAQVTPPPVPVSAPSQPGWQPTAPAVSAPFRTTPGGTGTPWVPPPPPGVAGQAVTDAEEPLEEEPGVVAEDDETGLDMPDSGEPTDGAPAEEPGWEPSATEPSATEQEPVADAGEPVGDEDEPVDEEAGEPAADEETQTVVVRPGDSLWRIAARDLGPGATPAQINRAWPAWHATNLETIGADPNRIFPGQTLRPPA